MPRSLIVRVVVVVVILVALLVVLSRIDPSRTPKRVIKVVPDNALTH